MSDIPAEVRAAVLKRDRYKCRRCGTEDNLTLHHVVPRGRTEAYGGVHEPKNLVTVCWIPCHALLEDHQIVVKFIKGHWYFSG